MQCSNTASPRQFLGMLNFYRRFLPSIAAVVRPLTDALAGSPKQLTWTKDMTSSFNKAKARLARATMLVHPRQNAQLRLRTDACERAIMGAIHQGGRPRTAARFLQPQNVSCRVTLQHLRSGAAGSVFGAPPLQAFPRVPRLPDLYRSKATHWSFF